jgi:hypothetical protein
MEDQKKDIIWILIDSLMIDFLDLNRNKKNYVEKVLLQGKTYTNVITAEKFTLGSFYALGTGLYGTTNGMNGIDYNFSKEKSDVVFVGDYLKKLGYTTFHYCDRRFRHFPSSGIDIYELAPYKGISKTFGQTYDTPRRREIINYFNNVKSPKFLFLHMFVQHDMLCDVERKGRIDTSQGYINSLKHLSKDLSIILKLLKLNGKELLIISTDHGVVLDADFIKEESSQGTSMREDNIKTFCTFISSDIKPEIIDKRISNIDILPTIFDYAGLPALPVQGKSLRNNTGTKFPICEGVEVYKYPFNRCCSSAYAAYSDNWKVVIKKDQEKELYKIEHKKEQKIKNLDDKHIGILDSCKNKIIENLSVNPIYIREKKINELKSENKDVLILKRENLPVKIILFATDIDSGFLENFIYDMKSQIEHYFDLHIFNVNKEISNRLSNVDYRIKVHKEDFKDEKIIEILDAYNNKPDFIGFVKSSNEYYEDYLYELRRLLEKNPEKDITYAKLEDISEITFLARADFIKNLIKKSVDIKKLTSIEEYEKESNIIRYKYPLGAKRKKKLKIFPLDNETIEMLKVEGINYIEERDQLKKGTIDIIVCSRYEKIKDLFDLSQLYNAKPAYIDYKNNTKKITSTPSISLKIIMRTNYQYWIVTDSKTKSKKIWWLWEALEYCVNKKIDKKEKPKIEKIFEIKPLRFFTNLLLIKLTYLPILNSYPLRKFLYSINIKDFESLGCKNTSILKRKLPYNKNFDLSYLPKK